MHNLSQKEKDFLEEIKKEKNGVPFSAAHTMINPNNDLNGDNQQIISDFALLIKIIHISKTLCLREIMLE